MDHLCCLCLVFLMLLRQFHCCLVVTCWERADLLALANDVYCIFVTFPCGILGQVWYLIDTMNANGSWILIKPYFEPPFGRQLDFLRMLKDDRVSSARFLNPTRFSKEKPTLNPTSRLSWLSVGLLVRSPIAERCLS